MDCVTPSNPTGLERRYCLPPGEFCTFSAHFSPVPYYTHRAKDFDGS